MFSCFPKSYGTNATGQEYKYYLPLSFPCVVL